MAFALKKAHESPFPGPRMASCVIRGGRLISWGCNRPSSGSLKNRHYDKNQAMHAELDALRNVDPKLVKGAILYVAGLCASKDIPTWSSLCCKSCQKVMKDYGIKAVIYHDKDFIPHIWRVS